MRMCGNIGYLVVCFMACAVCSDVYSRRVIDVWSQSQFDSLTSIITRQLESGERDIHVRLAAGRFKFSENHIYLKDLVYPKSSVTISVSSIRMVWDIREGTGTVMPLTIRIRFWMIICRNCRYGARV